MEELIIPIGKMAEENPIGAAIAAILLLIFGYLGFKKRQKAIQSAAKQSESGHARLSLLATLALCFALFLPGCATLKAWWSSPTVRHLTQAAACQMVKLGTNAIIDDVPPEFRGMAPGAAQAACSGIARLFLKDGEAKVEFCALVDPEQLPEESYAPQYQTVCFDTLEAAIDAAVGTIDLTSIFEQRLDRVESSLYRQLEATESIDQLLADCRHEGY